ncbi:MAG TPA: hypothetical protein ENK23_05330, partial [Sorangium sp.]|nr:hypothetical protein [Sorangium sp.]
MTLRSGPDGCTSGRGRMLLALAVASALLCYDPSAAAAATPKRTALALVAAGCAAWLAARAFDAHAHRKRRALAPSMPAALTAWWALCCWMLLSLLWSAQPRWESPALWTSAAVLGWCVYQLHPHGRRLVTTVVGTTVMVGASGAVLVQWLLGARGMQLHAGL